MWRLTRALTRRLLAERGAGERGAIAVFVALSMTVLLSFAAVAIDTAAARRDAQVLRNAADAAALAVALDCSRAVPADPASPPPTSCAGSAAAGATATAARLVAANAGSGATVSTALDGLSVTVTVTADYSRPIPIGPGAVSISSTATWTPPTIGYAASYPLAISYCSYLGLPAGTPTRLPSERDGLWLLPARQQITPTASTASSSCTGPDGAVVLRDSVMTPTDPGAPCGTTSARGRDVTGQTFEPVAFAARTCVASSQYGDVTSWPYGGYQLIVPVYDQVSGDQYRVWDYLGFHVMGVTADGGLWGFSTGKADPALGTPVPPSVRLTA